MCLSTKALFVLTKCLTRGEIHHAIRDGVLSQSDISELGNVPSGDERGRTSDSQISVADLIGIAVQDIQNAKVVYRSLNER